MSALTAHDAIVWPEPSPLQQWWTRVMGATTPPEEMTAMDIIGCDDARSTAPASSRTRIS
jgi:hypothetical protein